MSVEGAAKYYAYKNLIRGDWSIKRRGIVQHHVQEAWLLGVTFKVSLAGWRRANKENRRNVHAYAVGAVVAIPGTDEFDRIEEQMTGCKKVDVSYNPFGAGYFFSRIQGVENTLPVRQAVAAKLTEIGLHVYGRELI